MNVMTPPVLIRMATREDLPAVLELYRESGLDQDGGMTPGELPKSVAAFGIAGGIGQLFSTHPPIEERIVALRQAA